MQKQFTCRELRKGFRVQVAAMQWCGSGGLSSGVIYLGGEKGGLRQARTLLPHQWDGCTCGSAGFQACRLAGFKTRVPSAGSTLSNLRHAADLEIGETAGSETCATPPTLPASVAPGLPA
jgi:hypothetical protein